MGKGVAAAARDASLAHDASAAHARLDQLVAQLQGLKRKVGACLGLHDGCNRAQVAGWCWVAGCFPGMAWRVSSTPLLDSRPAPPVTPTCLPTAWCAQGVHHGSDPYL